MAPNCEEPAKEQLAVVAQTQGQDLPLELQVEQYFPVFSTAVDNTAEEEITQVMKMIAEAEI